MNLVKLAKTVLSGSYKGHFGQWAEDVLVRKLFPTKKRDGTYLDIGAYHPFKHSNTAYLWLKGWHGVNVDANPKTIELFNKVRTKDKNILAAVVPIDREGQEIELLLPADTKNISACGTCNKEVALERGFKDSVKIPAISINRIISENNLFNLDYLNIDVEGYDEYLIQDFDFSVVKPKVISIEDYSNSQDIVQSNTAITLFDNGYKLAGRAGPTSVFVF